MSSKAQQMLLFFAPLAGTSFLIIVTHSLFNAGLARLPSPEIQLAAFAVAKSLMHILQSPVNMTRQTVASLVSHKQHFYRVRQFFVTITAVVLIGYGLLAFTGASRWIFRSIMGLSGETLEASITMFRVLWLFPLMVAIREFCHGLFIRLRVTGLVIAGTLIRILAVLFFVSIIDKLSVLPSPVLAGLMMLSAGMVEAAIGLLGIRFYVGNIPRALSRLDARAVRLTPTAIRRFYAPLVVTTLIQTLTTPIVNSGLARSGEPEVALAAFAVAFGLGLIVISPILAFHQVPLSFLGHGEDVDRTIRGFGVLVAGFSTLALVVLGFTDLGFWIMTAWIHAPEQVSVMAVDVLRLMCVLPVIIICREYIWGYLLHRRKTMYLSQGKTVNIIALVLTTVIMTAMNPSNPAIIGIVAMISCDGCEFLYLLHKWRREVA